MRTISISALDELPMVAQTLLTTYPHPTIFLLEGEMGAGKTTFVKAVCELLGITETSSPTFGIVNEYESKKKVKVLHFDLYRLKSLQEAMDIGLEDYLQQEAYIFIEWPQLIEPLVDSTAIKIYIEETPLGRSFTF